MSRAGRKKKPMRIFVLIFSLLAAVPIITRARRELTHRPMPRASNSVSANLPPDIARQLAKGPLNTAEAKRLSAPWCDWAARPAQKDHPSSAAIHSPATRFSSFPQFRARRARANTIALSSRSPTTSLSEPTTRYPTPRPPRRAARREGLPPSSDTVPANLLKFYVYFSEPVRQTDQIFDRVHILDESGKTVYDPWRRFQQWSDDGRRLTLWIHPGRVTQGVNLREDFGAVLQPDHKYTLVIDAEVLDLAGHPMEALRKTFCRRARKTTIGCHWKNGNVKPPKAGTRDPLLITFPKLPRLRALMQRLIAVRGPAALHPSKAASKPGRLARHRGHSAPINPGRQTRYTVRFAPRLAGRPRREHDCPSLRRRHAASRHPAGGDEYSRGREVGSALADAFREALGIRPGFLRTVPEAASAKADLTRGAVWRPDNVTFPTI